MTKYLFIVIAILFAALAIMWKQLDNVNNLWKTSEANVKAYSEELSASGKKNTALQLTVDQLEYFSDSVLVALNETREELKIKDKNLKALQAVSSVFTVVDTVVINDTIFKDPTLAIDTLLGDKWYSLDLGLRYPSTITVRPEFTSEKHIVVYTKKETVKPPKKFFLLRWFQKKHKVLNVEVVEKNPYVQGESSKYVEIIK